MSTSHVSSHKPKQKRKNDFNIGRTIGKGVFGHVFLVEDKETKVKYAMKVLSKMHVLKQKKMNYVRTERDIMLSLNHPNIVRIHITFQDNENLYYITELAENGDLQKALNLNGKFEIPVARVLLGQILLAIAHMHQKRVLHRDLKPENILLDYKNRVKITDFGTAKRYGEDEPFSSERGSFVGSADYVSPEVLSETEIGPSSDLWGFGCIVYTLLTGQSPFHTNSQYQTFQLIVEGSYTFPDDFDPDAKDLVSKLLVKDPERRLGNRQYDSNYEPIRNHPFFKGMSWSELPKTPPPFFEVPPIEDRNSDDDETLMEDDYTHSSHSSRSKGTDKEAMDLKKYILSGEKILYEGDVIKRSLVNRGKRRFVLTNTPRLFYINMNKGAKKGEIPITKDLVVKIETKKNRWYIASANRTYNLSSDDAEIWRDKIMSVVNRLQ